MASDGQIMKLNPPVGAILTRPEGECLTLSLLWNCKLCFRYNAVLVQSRKWDLPYGLCGRKPEIDCWKSSSFM